MQAGTIARRFAVLGVDVDAVQIPDVIAQMKEWVARPDAGRYIAVTGMHGVMEAQRDASFADALRDADLVVPDGMPLVWLGRREGFDLARRVYGPELMLRFWQETSDRGYRHFFYGGGPGIADMLAERFAREFPGHEIAGTFSPPYRPLLPEEDMNIVRVIRTAKPDVVWVGLGTPKQELWMRAHRDLLGPAVLLGVGAAFDFHTGQTRNAPSWMGEHGLEWLYRLSQEPRRLWRRYLIQGSKFAAMVAVNLINPKWPVTSGRTGSVEKL